MYEDHLGSSLGILAKSNFWLQKDQVWTMELSSLVVIRVLRAQTVVASNSTVHLYTHTPST